MSDEINDNDIHNNDIHNNDDGGWDDGEIVRGDSIFKKFTPDADPEKSESENQKDEDK